MQHLDAIWGQDKYNFYSVPGRAGAARRGGSSWGLVHNNFQLALLVKCLFLAFLIALIIYCLVAVTVTVVVVVSVSASVSFLYIYKLFFCVPRNWAPKDLGNELGRAYNLFRGRNSWRNSRNIFAA